MNIELAGEIAEKGLAMPDGSPLMTAEQAKDFIIERMRVLEMTVMERVSAALSRHDELTYDLKEYRKAMKFWAEVLEGFGKRLAEIEKILDIQPFYIDPIQPGKGRVSLKARKESVAALLEFVTKQPPKRKGKQLRITKQELQEKQGKKRILTLPEAAKYLNLSPNTVQQYASAHQFRDRRLPSFRVGHGLRFDADELDAWLAIPKGKPGPKGGKGFYSRMKRAES